MCTVVSKKRQKLLPVTWFARNPGEPNDTEVLFFAALIADPYYKQQFIIIMNMSIIIYA